MIQFFAEGRPVPQGSKNAKLLRRGGQLVYKNGEPVIVQWDQAADRLNPWRKAVWTAARKVWTGGLIAGPVRLELVFHMRRPKSHYTTKGLRPAAPWYHTSQPDLTKLVRAVEDALTERVWQDDRQVVETQAVKVYASRGQPEGVAVKIRPIADPRVSAAEAERVALFESNRDSMAGQGV